MKKLKKVIPIVIAFIIGISTTVGAATVFNSKDITYSSDKTEVTNVKDSLDELYNKVGKCPDGWYCHTVPTTIADNVELGDYISMTPTSTSYTISKDLTGYDKDQMINPSELNLWRVIKKNDDGTVDVISEYVSDERIAFRGITGYLNVVGTLNEIASQYTNVKYVKKTRYVGYKDQPEFCSEVSLEVCPNSMSRAYDEELIRKIEGLIMGKTKDGTICSYYFAHRWYADGIANTDCYYNGSDFVSGCGGLYVSEKNMNRSTVSGLRPVITLKEDIKIVSGDGKSEDTAYKFE